MLKQWLPSICVASAFFATGWSATTTWIAPSNAGAARDYSNDLSVSLGSVFDLKWNTTMKEYSIWLWQQDTGLGYTYPGSAFYSMFEHGDPWVLQANSFSAKNAAQDEAGGTNWTVDLQNFTLAGSKIYFFSMCQNNSLVGAFTSHYFTVNQSSTSSATPSATSTTVSGSSSTGSASSTPTASPQGSSGLSSGTKVGLGVALGLGIPLVLLTAGLLVVVYRRYGKTQYGALGAQNKAEASDIQASWNGPQKMCERHELSAQPPGPNYVRPRYELPNEQSNG